MPAPALRIPLSLNMQEFEKNLQSARSATSEATQFIIKRFIDMNASVLATSGAAGSAVLAFRAVLGAIAPLSAAVAGIVGVFKLMGYATDLAKEKIEEFNEIAENAGKANVSTDFFQRFTKSGEELRLKVEDVSNAFERFNQLSKDKLGGSDLQKEVDKLQGYGNFAGNSGVGALGNATGTEGRLRATIDAINQALDAGQRLAALDLADKAFGPKIADNLRQDSNYLNQMLETADKMKADKIISDEQVGQAIELKNRLDEAQKVLAEKFKPIQDDLAKLGVNYHESWISVVETMSAAVTQANALYDAIKRIPDAVAEIGNAPFWRRLTEITEMLGLNSDPKSLGLTLPGEPGFAEDPARAALAAGLRNPSAVRQSMQQATEIQSAVRGDKSKGPPEQTDDSRDQFDVAIDSINKHIATLNADTAATFQNNAARQQLRAEFQALTAIMRDEGEVSQEQIDRYEKLRQSMTAQQALEASGIQLTKEHRDAFLSASAGILQAANAYDRSREKLQEINSASAQVGSALSNSFADAVLEAKNLDDVLNNLLKTLARSGINSVFSAFFNAPSAGGLSPFANLLGLGSIGRNADGTDNWRGGPTWVGERGPEIVNLPRGAQVIPNDVARGMSGGGATVRNTFMVAGDVSQATVDRLQAAVIAANRKADAVAQVFTSTQRMQQTGVG